MAQLLGEIGAQATQVVLTQMAMPAQLKAAEAARAEAAGDTAGAQRLREEANVLEKAYQAKWGIGSDFQKAAQAATAALQGLAGGSLEAALSGVAAPYLAGMIKDLTTDSNGQVNTGANAMAHAVLGAALAEAKGGSAAAGAVGGATAPLAANLLLAQLYPGKSVDQLSESEKQTVSALTTLTGTLAGALVAGNSAGAVTARQTAKNEVENNFLSQQQIKNKQAALANAKTEAEKEKIKTDYAKLDTRQQQSAAQAIKENALGVMTPVEYQQVKIDLQRLLNDPACTNGCRANVQASITQIDNILTWYKIDQNNKPLYEMLDAANTVAAIIELPGLAYNLAKLAIAGVTKGSVALAKIADQAVITTERLPWGSWASYSKVSMNGREYAQRGNRLYTRHAVDRMQPSALGTPAGEDGAGRSFPPSLIEDVINRGSTSTVTINGVERTIHSLGTAEVVTERGGNIVITVNPFRGVAK